MSSAIGGAGLFGYMGYRHSQEAGYDASDTIAYTSSSSAIGALTGVAGGAIARSVGFKGVSEAGVASIAAGRGLWKGLTWNPLKTAMKAAGREKFGYKSIPKPLRTPLLGLAIMAAGVGAIAYGSRNTVEPKAYASPDGYSGTSYNSQSVKERMGMLGAAGEMVFGMHNMRHG